MSLLLLFKSQSNNQYRLRFYCTLNKRKDKYLFYMFTKKVVKY